MTSGVDLALYLVEKWKERHFAHLVARALVVFNRRAGKDSQEGEFLQFRNHIHSEIIDNEYINVVRKAKATEFLKKPSLSKMEK
jgi:transcriptional regulator GlxA family with amidase domain